MKKEYDFDICAQYQSGLINPVSNVSFDTSYSKDISLELTEYPDGDTKLVRRLIRTPAGPLEDLIRIAPAGREYGISPNPEKIEFLIKTRSDLEKIKYLLPDPKKHVDLSGYYRFDEIIGEHGLTEVFIRGGVDHFAGDSRGITQMMIDYYDDPELLRDTLDLFSAHIMAETKACLEQGAKHIFGSWYYTSLSTGWSPQIFKDLFVPMMKKHIDLVHSYNGVYTLYDDGKMMSTLADYVSAGADVVETLTPPPVGDIDLKEAKRIAGSKTTLKGYIDLIYVLQHGSPELVRKTVIDAIETAAPGGRFILGTSDSIRENTTEENLRAYFNTAREYGKKYAAL